MERKQHSVNFITFFSVSDIFEKVETECDLKRTRNEVYADISDNFTSQR